MMPEYDNEELTLNPTQVFSVHNWALKPNQHERPPFTDHMKAICNIDMPVESKAPTTSSKTVMKTEASKSKTVQSDKETQPISVKDKSPSHPSAFTLVVGEMHKEAQQAASGLTSLGATSEEGSHPQLSSGCDASSDSIAEADPEISAPIDFLPKQQGIDEGTQNYSLDHIFARTNPSVLVDQTKSTGDGLKIIHTDLDESEEEETERYEDTHTTSYNGPEDTSIPHPPFPKSVQIQELMAQVQLLQSQTNKLEQQKAKAEAEVASLKSRPLYPDINQLTELLVTSLKHEISKLLASHDFARCLPTELKELPLKIIELSRDVKELKKHVRDMEIELHGDLKEILKKLKSYTSPTKGEKNTYSANTHSATKKLNLKNDLFDLMGIDVVEEYQKKKLLEDGTDEVISNFKVSDLHLVEWREGEIVGLVLESLKKASAPVLRYLEDQDHLHFSLCGSLCSGTKTEEGLCKELQFSLVDNSKLDDVYILNRS
ncbi:hypothetical protein Tco_0648410 [Tanacetum coccineum]